MADGYFKVRNESGHTGNDIPLRQQLPRTPSMLDVKGHLELSNEESEEPQHLQREQDENEQMRISDFNSPQIKTEPDDPNSMLKGMKGYQLTAGDLEFIEKMKEDKLIKKLRGDLEEVQKLLKKETMAFELACATREKAQAELRKFPSCEDLTEWIKVVLSVSSPSAEFTDVAAKSLLAMVTEENVHKVMEEKELEVARMKRMVANKKRKEAKERGQLEKRIASEQLKIQDLMSQLSTMKSELAQQEEANRALEMPITNKEAPENKVEAEAAKTSEQPQAAKAKSRGKKTVGFADMLQDSKNQSKTTRSKVTNGKTDSKSGVQRRRKQVPAEVEENPGLRRSKRIASRR